MALWTLLSSGALPARGLASLAADAGVAPADGVALALPAPLGSLFARAGRRQLGPAGRARTAAARTPGRAALFRLVAREPPWLMVPSSLDAAASRGLCGPGDVLVPAALAASGSVAAASRLVALPGVAGQDSLYPRLVLLAAPVRPEDAALVASLVAAVLLVAVPVGPLVV